MSPTSINRRQFLRLSTLTGGAALLTACGAGALTPTPPAATPRGSVANTESTGSAGQERVIVGDVLDYKLTSDEWPGACRFLEAPLAAGPGWRC